jgi:5'-nucleotidase
MNACGIINVCGQLVAACVATAAQAGDLKILHINDHHSHLKPDGRMSLKLDGQSTRVRSGGMPASLPRSSSWRMLPATTS